jgi:hypothetical protein
VNPILFGKVERGKLILDYPEQLVVRLASLEGKRVEVIVRKETKTRTNQQNRYLFGVVYAIISDCTGYDPEQVHDAMKVKFASKHLDNGLVITERTSKMTTERMTQYIDDIKRWASEFLGCYIPDAGEVAL